jgi:hypothetical protein
MAKRSYGSGRLFVRPDRVRERWPPAAPDRVIAKRIKVARQIARYEPAGVPGRLDDQQYYLGRKRPRCRLCHPVPRKRGPPSTSVRSMSNALSFSRANRSTAFGRDHNGVGCRMPAVRAVTRTRVAVHRQSLSSACAGSE